MMRTLTSVSLRQHTSVEVGGLTYRYVKTKQEFFVGFEEQDFDGQTAQIATVEKALVDLVQLHRTAYTSDRVAEVLADSRHLLDYGRLNQYLELANLTTQRIFGLLFETLGIEYDDRLLQRAQKALASAHLTPDSKTYNAKWRLYYDANMLARCLRAT
jgi:predicted transcriptional regulator of viral defense system